jgi:hypothetical protein
MKVITPVPKFIEKMITEVSHMPKNGEKSKLEVQTAIFRYQRAFIPMLGYQPDGRGLRMELLSSYNYYIWGKLVELGFLHEYRLSGPACI